MNHDEIRNRLDDYVDGILPSDQRLDVGRHLEACRSCADEVAALRSLLDRASDLPSSIEPHQDLWPELEAAIRRRPVVVARRLRWIAQPRWAFAGGAAAAAVLMLVVVSWFSNHGGEVPGAGGEAPAGRDELSPYSASRHGPSQFVPLQYVPSVVRGLEHECMGAGKLLLASMSGWDSSRGADVAASLGESLRSLDQAIEETRSALEADPRNTELIKMLTSRYQQKLSLLHDAMRLVKGA